MFKKKYLTDEEKKIMTRIVNREKQKRWRLKNPDKAKAIKDRHKAKWKQMKLSAKEEGDVKIKPMKLPFSFSRRAGDLIFVSEQVGASEGKLVSEDFRTQMEKAIENIKTILEKEGMGMENIVDVTAFLVDKEDYALFNEIYLELFKEPFPTRTTVTVKSLPLGAKVELKVVANG